MSNSLFPTLSSIGWTSNLGEKLDYALAHFFESEETQTYLYPGQIADVHSIIARNVHDISGMIGDLSSTLNLYLKGMFDYAEVEGEDVSKKKGDNSNRVTISLKIKVGDNQKQVVTRKFVNFKFNKFESIINASNYGQR